MSKTAKYLIVAVIALVILTGLAVVGLYLGGRLFATLQKLPASAVTLTTLQDYWEVYQSVPKIRRSFT
jgi:hypothetical protein